MTRITKIVALNGRNIWSCNPVLEICLSLDGTPEQFREVPRSELDRLRRWLEQNEGQLAGDKPEQAGEQSALWRRIHDAANPIELFQRLAAELQALAVPPRMQSRIVDSDHPREAWLLLEIAEESLARLATSLAHALVWPGQESPPAFFDCRQRLRDAARNACLGSTTGPIAAAARARGIPVTRLDGDCLLQLGYGARQRRIQGVITDATRYLAEQISRDKLLTKKLMKQLGLPTAEGRLANDPEEAWAIACEIGAPVVVKPRDADYANGVSVNLQSRPQVTAAWELARQFRSDVLVERHLAGVPHRLLIVNDELVAAVRRDPAQVFGDGRRTMRELIDEANRDPRRGDGPDHPWFTIQIDEQLRQALAQQAWELESVPPAGCRVILQASPQACYAEMIQDVTETVHPDIAAAARDAVRVTGLDVAGVDIMATDISQSLAEQGGGILEVNAGPAIYLHRYPVCNPPRPVEAAVVASLIPFGENGTIPLVAVMGDELATDVSTWIGEFLEHSGNVTGVANKSGIRMSGRQVTQTMSDSHAGCQALLLNPRVEAAVCELSASSIRESGLPFDACQVAVLAARIEHPTEPRSTPTMLEKCRAVLVEAVSPQGLRVVNLDDSKLASHCRPGDPRLLAAALSPQHPFLKLHAREGGLCAYADFEEIVISYGETILVRYRQSDILPPRLLGGRVLAVAAAYAVGVFPHEPASAGPASIANGRSQPHVAHRKTLGNRTGDSQGTPMRAAFLQKTEVVASAATKRDSDPTERSHAISSLSGDETLCDACTTTRTP